MTPFQITTLVIMIVVTIVFTLVEFGLYDIHIRKERKSGWGASWDIFWIATANNTLCEIGAVLGFILSMLC